ncbi:MAG: rod shape-determining protein RodA [Oscillospiraceae bacterium]|jgi:rod shape determining protein RodA|nr:rod shape-determining protein RodA [Oscillospiraceae bacterium]
MQQNAISRLARPHFDWVLCLTAYALAIFGVLAVTITNFNPELGANRSFFQLVMDSGNGRWQAIFVLISPIAVAGMMMLNYQLLGRIWPMLYIGSCVLLLVVLFTDSIAGMSGWFQVLWDRTIQPSELSKVAIIISLSSELSRHKQPIPNWKYFLRLCAHIGIPLLLIIMQPDVGTMLVFIVIFLTLLLVSGCSLKLWLGIIGTGIVACVPVMLWLQEKGDFRWRRITAFIDPTHDTTGSGFQILNSMAAVGSGGIKGVGMFVPGTMTHLNYVPENHTDFIFSSIGETMGFIGCFILLALYITLFLRMLMLSYNTPDRYGRLVIAGVMSMLLFHVFENVGMNIGVMPITGIPLPFISYGGSNLIANMAGIGLVLNVTQRKQGARNAHARR